MSNSLPMVSVELKKTYPTQFFGPLRNFIAGHYNEDVSKFTDALNSFEQLRNAAAVPERSENGIATIYKYCAQVRAMQSKFPFSENEIRVTFSWVDAFANANKSSSGFSSAAAALMSGKEDGRKFSSYNANFDLVSMLFNAAALYSQIAVSQNFATENGLKTACNAFQSAAGIFAYLKAQVPVLVTGFPLTPDLKADILSALASIMLAQAQECFLLKALAVNTKDSIVAKVAAQAADYYDAATNAAQGGEAKSVFDKNWQPLFAAKRFYYASLTHFHEAQICKEKEQYGQEIARLQACEQFCIMADKLKAVNFDNAKALVQRAQKQRAAVEKDNSVIYHEVVPPLDQLQQTTRADMVKATPFESEKTLVLPNSADLFSALVPLAVMQHVNTYNARRDELIRAEGNRMEEATAELNATLTSLNLPASIEALEQPAGVPQAILEKAAKVREYGGARALQDKLTSLEGLYKNDSEVLQESLRVLDEEQKDDEAMKRQFGEKWTRTPSGQLTEKLREEIAKFRGILSKARDSDAVVREKLQANQAMIVNLSKPDAELLMLIPASGASSMSPQAADVVAQLKRVLADLETLKSKRKNLETDLKAVIQRDSFANKLGSSPNSDPLSVMDEQLQLYRPMQTQIADNVAEQRALLDSVRSLNEAFLNLKQSSDAITKRETVLKNLDAAYNSFVELDANLSEGMKFYGDFLQLLLKLQNKCNDLCFARKTEQKEYLSTLTREITTKPTGPTPTLPSHASSDAVAAAGAPSASSAPGSAGERPVPAPRANRPPRPPAPETATSAMAPPVNAAPEPQRPVPQQPYNPPSYGSPASQPQQQQQTSYMQPQQPSQGYQSYQPQPQPQPQQQAYSHQPMGYQQQQQQQQQQYQPSMPPQQYGGYAPSAPPSDYYGQQPQYQSYGAPAGGYAAQPYSQQGGYQQQQPQQQQQQQMYNPQQPYAPPMNQPQQPYGQPPNQPYAPPSNTPYGQYRY